MADCLFRDEEGFYKNCTGNYGAHAGFTCEQAKMREEERRKQEQAQQSPPESTPPAEG